MPTCSRLVYLAVLGGVRDGWTIILPVHEEQAVPVLSLLTLLLLHIQLLL